MAANSSRDDNVAGILKIIVFCTPPSIVPILWNVRTHRLIFGLSFILGVLLQAILPPRRKGLVPMLAVTVLFTLAYSLLWK